MADETTTEITPAADTPAAAPAEKKTRAPRRLKAVGTDVSAVSQETPAKKTRAKRGSKVAAAKAEKSVAEPKAVATRAPRAKAVVPAFAAPSVLSDDFADLIKLEEENKQLRKELAEKLRAENADLRKRLGQG